MQYTRLVALITMPSAYYADIHFVVLPLLVLYIEILSQQC